MSTNSTLKRNRKRKKRQRFIRGLFKCSCLVLFILVAVTFLSKTLNGEGGLGGSKKKDSFYTEEIPKGELKGVPESLKTLYSKNKEARQFVRDYEKNHENPVDTDITGDVAEGKIPLFIQWDERWGYQQYGDDFMAVTGCGPTALSMVYTGLTGDTSKDPYTMAMLAQDKGYYVEGTGSSWSMMTELAGELGLTARELSKDESFIIQELRSGHPVICIMGPGDFTDGGHFIVLTGVTKNGKIRVCDPNSRKNSKKKWELSTIMEQMKNLWSYQS